VTIVGPFEADILHVLHAILGRGPTDRALAVVLGRRVRPECLGRPALGLIQDALAGGSVRRLAGRGGWHRGRFLRGDRVVEGRLWERSSPEALGLLFSGQTMEFLIRLVADEPTGWSPWPDRGTLGDRLLLFFAYEAFRRTEVGPLWRNQAIFWSLGLCRLAFPADFAGLPELDGSELARWIEPSDAWVLESLQGILAASWAEAGRLKAGLDQPAMVLAIGEQETWVAGAYLSALEAAGRRDLARFFLEVARELLGSGPCPRGWIGSPALRGLRLDDRGRVSRASVAPLACLDRLRAWERQAREVGYFDEGYAAAQLWKSDWERLGGEDLRDRARALLREADPLAGPAGPVDRESQPW